MFPEIDTILVEFVISHILSIQRQQMNESLLYRAIRLDPFSFNNIQVNLVLHFYYD